MDYASISIVAAIATQEAFIQQVKLTSLNGEKSSQNTAIAPNYMEKLDWLVYSRDMKNRISILFGVSILALATTSCGFPNIFQVKLKTLTISDSTSKTYVVGESYFDFANLTITGKYSNGETKHFEREDVAFTLTSGGTTYDISSPFSASFNLVHRYRASP